MFPYCPNILLITAAAERRGIKPYRLTPNKNVSKIIHESQTLENGLRRKIKDIAAMNTKIQFELALIDIIKSITSYSESKLIPDFYDLFKKAGNVTGLDISIDYIINRLIEVTGSKKDILDERNKVESTLYDLCRNVGYKFKKKQIISMTVQNEYYSRIGINALGILYDCYFDYIKKLELPKYYEINNHIPLWYYSSFREKYPGRHILDMLSCGSTQLTIGHYTIKEDTFEFIMGKYPARGESVIMDVISKIK
jgi:hypothetical protein